MNWQIMFKGPTCILGYYKFDQSFPKIYDSKTLTVCASLDEVIEITEGALTGKAPKNHKNEFRKCNEKPFKKSQAFQDWQAIYW